jgi:linoleoyl-CoA desaturase
MKVRFNGKNQAEFYPEVKRKVEDYFKSNNIGKNANGEMIFKSVFFLSSLVGLYLLILLGNFSVGILLVFAILLGMVQSFIGFNVAHDAIHGSYSSNSKVNKFMSFWFNIIGASPYVWSIAHNKVHHTFTNIPGHDEDLEVAPGLVRVCPEDPRKPIMKFQQFYAFFLYGLASLSWVFRKDYVKFFQKKIGHTDNSKHPKIEYFNLFFYKAIYYTLFIVIPLVVMDITWVQFLIGFLAMHLAEGFVMGLVFQLAHVVEGMDFPNPDEAGNMGDTWAIHQMRTTANFSRESSIANFLCGGLNFQIEHHLFPNVCHVHYTEISKIVKATADEYGVPYIENETFFGALKSHYKTLKYFGRAEPVMAS